MSAALHLPHSAAPTADGLGSEGQSLTAGCPAPRSHQAALQHRTPFTTYHRSDPRALQARWDAEADRAAFARLRAAVRAAGPDGLPLWAGALLIPAALALAALLAAIVRGGL